MSNPGYTLTTETAGESQSSFALAFTIYTRVWPALVLVQCHYTYPGAAWFLISPEMKGQPFESGF